MHWSRIIVGALLLGLAAVIVWPSAGASASFQDSSFIGVKREVLANDTGFVTSPEGHILRLSPSSAAYLPGDFFRQYKDWGLKDPQRNRRLFIEESDWKNSLVGWMFPASFWDPLPRFFKAWLRNFVAATLLYLVVGVVWAYYIYFVFRRELFGAEEIPSFNDVTEQMRVSMMAMPLYSALPCITEWMVEAGWTRAYPRLADVGLVNYVVLFFAYMTFIEYGVYWMHRLLHDIRVGYDKLHYIHHKYNKEHSLSPFAGLAFHPLDGILQAIPYTIGLFLFPMHMMTHEIMLFATGVWTTNIHDNLHGRCEPFMGAGYHTIHHTTYKHNYGHYFIFMDWLHGTLVDPIDYKNGKAKL